MQEVPCRAVYPHTFRGVALTLCLTGNYPSPTSPHTCFRIARSARQSRYPKTGVGVYPSSSPIVPIAHACAISHPRYSARMNGTSITVSVIVLLAVVAFGGYFIFTNYVSPGLAGQEPALVTSDDVRVQDITVGDGAGAVPGSIVSVLYVGMLEDGSVFDSSEAYDNEPLVFTLGDPGLIAGFQF